MTDPIEAAGPPRPRLARAFWGGLVGGALALALIPFALSYLRQLPGATAMAPVIAFVHGAALLGWIVAVPVWVWRAARHAAPAARLGARAVVIGFYASLVGLALHALDGYEDYRVRAQVHDGLHAVRPARDALAEACLRGTLAPGVDREALGLEAAPAYVGPYTRSVELRVTGEARADVVVTFRALSRRGLLGEYDAVRDGDTFVFEGHCDGGEIAWTIAGTIESRYRP